MMETTGITHMSDGYSFKLGTVGKAMPEAGIIITEDGDVTPTMKAKRKSINEQYRALIESMYRDGMTDQQP